MNEPQLLDDSSDYLFLRCESAGSSARWWTLGGCAALALAAIGFVLSLVGNVGQFTMHTMTTLPTIIGLGALGAGRALANTPSQVSIGPGGIAIEGRRTSSRHGWEQVGWATIGTGALNQRRHLKIFDSRGKTIAVLSDAFDNFDMLADLVKQRIAAKGDGTAGAIARGKSKRMGALTGAFSLLMLTAGITVAYSTYYDQRAARLLATSATPGEGEIVRRFLAPDGVTPRLEYRVTSDSGETATRNAELQRPYWDSLADATTVPIIYVPGEPAISRLVEGEAEVDDITKTPLGGYAMSAAAGVMFLFMAAVSIMQFCGYDIDFDSQSKKLSVKRFGAGK